MPSVWAFSPLFYWWPFFKNVKLEGGCSGVTGITWSVQPEFLIKCLLGGGGDGHGGEQCKVLSSIGRMSLSRF